MWLWMWPRLLLRLQSMYVHLNCQLRSVLVGNWAHKRDCQHRDLVYYLGMAQSQQEEQQQSDNLVVA